MRGVLIDTEDTLEKRPCSRSLSRRALGDGYRSKLAGEAPGLVGVQLGARGRGH